MNKNDIFILGVDKKVSIKEHLKCYNIPENGHMTMLAAKSFGLPINKLHAGTIFDQEGIHGGVKVIEDFKFSNKHFSKGNFIEVFISLKPTIKEMTNRIEKNGFKLIKIINSNKKHIYHLILRKN